MEHEQRVRRGQIEIGRETISWIFGQEVDTSGITEEQLRDLGRLIEDIGLRGIKRA